MDHATGTICLMKSEKCALCDMRSALCDVSTVQCGMGALCDMRSALCDMDVICDKGMPMYYGCSYNKSCRNIDFL